MLKVLFICSSLEPKQDGVGDYTRKLAQALTNHNNRASIIAINDRRMTGDIWNGKQIEDNTEVDVLRLSSNISWEVRLGLAKKFIDAFNPDWISLQFVPFGYQIKGLPFNLGKKLKKIGGSRNWHIMFHELSVNKNDSLKFKIWAFFQVSIIKSLLNTLKPLLITTNTKIYQCRLEQLGYAAVLLPLFSNIQRIDFDNKTNFANNIPKNLYKKRDDYIIGTIFGSFFYKGWDIRSLLNKFSQGYEGKKVIIASIGKMSFGMNCWKKLQRQYSHIQFVTFGIQDSTFISYWLSEYTDFGILTTPPELAGKSGSFMAFKEHGLPVVCKEKNVQPENICKVDIDNVLTEVNSKKDFLLPVKYKPESGLNAVANQFINELNSSNISKAKILFISHRFYPEIGGIETNAEILASGFCDLGAEVHLVTWTRSNSPKKFPFIVIRNPGVMQLLKEHSWADVILENNPSLRLSWPNLFIQKPLVIALNTWVTRLNGKKGFRDKLKQVWFGRAKKMIAVSDSVRKKEWPNAIVIENPYNNNLFRVNADIKKHIPFVFLGRLVSDKGAEQAIKAISILIKEQLLSETNTQLTIIGDGPEKKNLASLVKALKLNNAVKFTGAMREQALVDCLNMHRFVLVPSSWEEPYGNVVLEGMACGCVPIASNGGGLPEAVGYAGFLFKRNDLNDMVSILKCILKNPLKTEAINIETEKHLTNHSISHVSKKYYDILQKAANFK